ncbi:MAG: serine/threonine protein kinase [Planctomycetaceae bacterium]|nr:serine/threonine protein kinase [Planctomycetaceae bacterium]
MNIGDPKLGATYCRTVTYSSRRVTTLLNTRFLVNAVRNKTRSIFRNAALLSGLVTQDQLDCGEAALRAATVGAGSGFEITDQELADKLVEMEVVTSYQADQMLLGRNKLNLGRYLVTEFIGQGGMGQVFKAVHNVMGRECAVKILPIDKSTEEAIANFTREIRTLAKLDHPNLVRAYDAGNDGSVHYLVTEYVPGTDLRRLIRSEGPLTMQQAASVIMQSARGLHHAHESGLIHRDVKPGNILVTPEGVAKVSDLGLAGFIGEGDKDPRAGKIVGTADYLSPEQIRNPHDVSHVSDVYSLGCTLYYALTGKVPFPGGTPNSKAQRHLAETPWHPKRFNPDVLEEFVEVIADMMEKEPNERMPSAAEVAARLEPWATEVGLVPAPLTKSPWAPPPVPTDDDDAAQDTDGDRLDYSEEYDSSRQESASQWSQTTDPLAGAGHDTRHFGDRSSPPLPPPLPFTEPRRHDLTLVIRLLAAVIPLSVAIGIAVGFILRDWMS